jgi:hypothetical protein
LLRGPFRDVIIRTVIESGQCSAIQGSEESLVGVSEEKKVGVRWPPPWELVSCGMLARR